MFSNELCYHIGWEPILQIWNELNYFFRLGLLSRDWNDQSQVIKSSRDVAYHKKATKSPSSFYKKILWLVNISIPKYSLIISDYDPVKLSTKCSLPTFYVYPYGPESSSGPCVCDRPSWHQISEGMLQLFFGQHQLSCQFVLFQYEACSFQVSWSS